LADSQGDCTGLKYTSVDLIVFLLINVKCPADWQRVSSVSEEFADSIIMVGQEESTDSSWTTLNAGI
jgi:hypothetical protein